MTNTRRTRGAGGVFKDASGTWHFRKSLGTDPGTGKAKRIEARGKTKSEARERFEKKLSEYERTGLIASESMRLEDYTRRWLADYRTHVKPTTYRTRAGRLKACNEYLGSFRIGELTPEHIRMCIRSLGERLAPSTLKDHFVSLKMVLDQAELDGLIPLDPCRKVRPPRVERTQMRILGPDDPQKLIDSVATMPQPKHGSSDTADDLEMWELLFTLAFATGLRPGERRGLTPSELVTEGTVHGIHVQHQLQQLGLPHKITVPKWLMAQHVWGGQWITTPKTHAGDRFVPISDDLWARLWARIGRLNIGRDELVFRNHLGHPISGSNEARHFKRALAAAGLPQVRLYSARHWTATMTALADMPDDARIAIMGHTDPSMTLRYTHRNVDSLARLMARAIPGFRCEDVVEAEVVDD